MNNKKLEKAMDIKESLKAIDKLRHILCVPYPTMHDGTTDVSFVCFDATTRELLKQTIRVTLDKREKELNKEFENL